MKQSSNRKKHRLFLFFTVVIAVCTVFCGGLFYLVRYHSDLIYRAKKDLASLTAKNPLTAEQVTAVNLSLDALLADSRCTQDQSVMLINEQYPLPADFSAEVSFYRDSDVQMNDCMQEAYAALSAAVMERYGEHLYIRDAYRSAAEQAQKQEEKGDIAAAVGASEHQAGLALDVYVPQFAGPAFIKSAVGRFVDDHCQEYGWIVRYPSYGTKKTGIGYEPWHLRYVGIPHAQIIMEGYLTLEEYMESLKPGEFYRYGGCLISRQSGDVILAPASYESVVVSSDNMGGHVFTWRIGS